MQKIAWALCIVLCLGLFGCVREASPETTPVMASPETQATTLPPETTPETEPGMIYLYGERHGEEAILDLELELWQKYYHEQGMRHLFVEFGYFTGAYLNLWMQAKDDTILYQLFDDWEGTQGATDASLAFYRAIKDTCPETVFHGTDVGHQYWSTGSRYLDYLKSQGMEASEEYFLTQQAIEQGRTYYSSSADQKDVYREDCMAENLIRTFDALTGESVMGIYGAAHTDLDALNYTGQCDSMGKQLKAKYGDMIVSEDLSMRLLASMQPEKVETLEIGDKSYTAEYYGKEDLRAFFPEYSHREFWRLVDAYEDFSQWTFTGNVLPQSNYPMLIAEGQVYMIVYTLADGSIRTEYHLCDGMIHDGQLTTREVAAK